MDLTTRGSDDLSIRNMRDEDIDSALDLINSEGWGYTHSELERMLLMDPEGSFLYEDKRLIGVVTTVTYGKTGVIGHLVVSKQARGKKIGQTLMKKAVEYCETAGSETILLYATPDGLPVYRKFGFEGNRQVLCAKSALSERDHGSKNDRCTKMSHEDLDDIMAMDERLFGDNRQKILQLLFAQYPQHSWKLEREGRLVGFAMGRATPSGFDVGPWECTSGPEDAERILRALLRSFGKGVVYLPIFADNPGAVKVFDTLTHLTMWKTTFMVRGAGRYPHPEGAYGISSLELG